MLVLPDGRCLFYFALYFKPVSHTPDCLDILRVRRIVLYLLSDLLDMHGHRGDISDGFHIPDFAEQFFLRVYMVRMPGQEGEQGQIPLW